MIDLQDALERVTYHTSKFPQEEFQVIRQNYKEAKPYLYAAIDKAMEEAEELEENYELHFYALFFLAEFKDTEAFEKIIDLVHLPSDLLDDLIGDLNTDGLDQILYNTFNGNVELLKDVVCDVQADEYVRNSVLHVLGQLYLDGTLDKQDWVRFLKERADTEDEEISTWLVGMICECHLIELLPQVRHLFDESLVDPFVYGGYDSCVDMMFSYERQEQAFFQKQISADSLKTWAMFEQEETQSSKNISKKDFQKLFGQQGQRTEKKVKVGRNDPCPCGSGKKYKYCCLNKPKEEKQKIEREQERQEWLKEYPQTGAEKIEGRIYLDDYFDAESIEIDQMLYIALKQRGGLIFNREDEKTVTARRSYYLWEAFSRLSKKLDREGITTEEYDQKYAIHYRCREWVDELLDLLKHSREDEKYETVLKYFPK